MHFSIPETDIQVGYSYLQVLWFKSYTLILKVQHDNVWWFTLIVHDHFFQHKLLSFITLGLG